MAFKKAYKGAFSKAFVGQPGANVNPQWVLSVEGQSSGTPTAGTIVFTATEDVSITSTGDVIIAVANADDVGYRKHTVTVQCVNNGNGTIIFSSPEKILSCGNYTSTFPTINFYTGTNTTSPILLWDWNDLGVNVKKIRQSTNYTTILPITGNKQLPVGLTYIRVSATNSWTYAGSLPTGITYLNISCLSMDWTGLDVGNSGNIGYFNLANYRQTKMTSDDMVVLLTQLTNRTGSLPSTVTINDYADYAAPTQSVVDAVALLKSTKSVTTVNLGA